MTPVARDDAARTRHFASGNEAVIDAALAAGCHFFAGYPVTPATEILEAAAEKFPEQRSRDGARPKARSPRSTWSPARASPASGR